ncbi:MAG: aldehyde dehydrogenase family protein [Candidatus Aenigmarchaeota archaeon]|nr:aldehyde dehydrogenase family protein [Candidatus Aenigmarchaeota archaeon]
MPEYCKLYINGWTDSTSGETFKSLNPATEEVIVILQKGNAEDVNKAVDVAEKTFDSWSETPAPKRGSDVQEAIDIFEYMAGEGRRLFGHTTPSELKNKFCMTVRRPIGVVGIITPWNFPIAIPAWKLAPALVCGNTVIWKPSSDTPLCAVELVKILEKAGVPKGVVSLITGPAEPAGTEIVKHKKILGISFTGSRDTGLWITQNAGIKKIGLELGGKNGVIVMPDADMKLALDGIIWGAFGTTGQRCTAASRVILHEEVKKQLEDALRKRATALRLGSGLDANTDVGPLINKAAVEKSERYTKIGQEEGAKLLCGGERLKGKGFFFEPTIFTDVSMDMRIAKEEIFGPVLSLISVSSLDEAIEAMNSVEYGLSSSIYTNDIKAAFKAIEKIQAGITYVNSSTTGAETHLPFGGVKQTGNGTREAGILGIDEFSEVKTVYIDYSGKLQRAQIDTE